jgi:hypothetical protein
LSSHSVELFFYPLFIVVGKLDFKNVWLTFAPFLFMKHADLSDTGSNIQRIEQRG